MNCEYCGKYLKLGKWCCCDESITHISNTLAKWGINDDDLKNIDLFWLNRQIKE